MQKIYALLQICLLSLFTSIGNWLSGWLHIEIPGSIIGLCLLFICLELGVIKTAWVELGATWLLAELLLFFIPSAVGIIQYGRLVQIDGAKFVIVIALSTMMVMLVSGMMTEFLAKIHKQRGESTC